MPTCPRCGDTLEFHTVDNMDYYGRYMKAFGYGRCHTCDRTYRWTEVFTYNTCEHVEEVRL